MFGGLFSELARLHRLAHSEAAPDHRELDGNE